MFNTEFRPAQIHPTVFIAQGAIVLGNVTLAENCSVWFNAVIRSDTDSITIGANTNIQDGAILHVDPGDPIQLGQNVTVGHRAIIHGATVEDEALIGMGATVLNGAVIGTGSIVGANALVTGGKIFPPQSLILGSPAKFVRHITPDELTYNRLAAQTYMERAKAFMANQ